MTLDWTMQQAGGDNAWFTSNATKQPLNREIVLNTETEEIFVGDGTTQLQNLTAWGGGSSYTAGSGLTLSGNVFSLGGTLTGDVAFSGAFNIDFGNASISLSGGTASRVLGTNASNVVEYINTTGTGDLVRATSPTFLTDIRTPLIYGSTSASGNLTLESTSNATKGRIIFSGVGTNNASIQGLVGSLTIPAIYMGVASPSATNFTMWSNGDSTVINAPGGNSVTIQNSGNTRFSVTNTAITLQSGAATSGAITGVTITVPSSTNQTASTNIPNFRVNGNSKSWAAGTVANQYWNYFTANTVNVATITNSYGLFVEAATVGTGAITNNHAIGCSGTLEIISGRLEVPQGADVASANNLVLGGDGNVFEITGTTQINLISNLSWKNGCQVTLLFTSTPTVKHNQATSGTNITIQLAGAVDFVASAGDTLTLVLCEIGGTQAWREISRAVI